MIVGLKKKKGSSCVYFLITTYISSLQYHLLFVQSVPAHLIANLLEVDFISVKGYSMLCKYKVTGDDFIILKKSHCIICTVTLTAVWMKVTLDYQQLETILFFS